MHAIPATATGVILINLLVASLHGIAHVQLGVDLSAWQQAFVVLVIVAAPLVSLAGAQPSNPWQVRFYPR